MVKGKPSHRLWWNQCGWVWKTHLRFVVNSIKRELEGKIADCLFSRRLPRLDFLENLAVLVGGGAWALLPLGMAAVLIKGVLIFMVSINSWPQYGSFSLVAQSLHPTGAGFLSSTRGL